MEQRNSQALLGHRDPKSTEVYLHVSNKSLMGIRSPFDKKDGSVGEQGATRLCSPTLQSMDKPTVQDIFHRFYPAYLDQYSLSPVQTKVAHNIMNCKTGAYGANVCVCEDCGSVQIHYNSCRNRCCPMCQAVPKEMWMDARREDVLDAPYFHLVFTVPDLLNPVIYSTLRRHF